MTPRSTGCLRPSCARETGFLVEAGEVIPADGEVIEGVASVDESAITGESAPVIRESGGDFSSVTGGTRVLSDWLVVRVTVDPGESFLDRMICMVESARRQKTPNEIALWILLVKLTLVFLLATVTLLPFSIYSVEVAKAGNPITITVLVALLVCLIPTTIGGLLSAIGLAGIGRMLRANVIATSGRAVEAAGDVDVLLLDKTGTITLGNRQATSFRAASGVTEQELADAAQLASLADETPEGRSIVVLAKQKFSLRERDVAALGATFVPFSAQTRMSGVDLAGRQIRKGAADAIRAWVASKGGSFPDRGGRFRRHHRAAGLHAAGGCRRSEGARRDRAQGRRQGRHQGALRAAAPDGHPHRDDHRRQQAHGGRPSRPKPASTISSPKPRPEAKLKLIRENQAGGRLVAMTGDGTNDAPALAQADVAVAMNTGTQAAKEAGNMVDLDSNPTKLLEIVEIGKQLLITRGALDHVLDRQRRCQVLRDHPCGVRVDLPAAHRTERHVPGNAGERHPVGGDLQRADHHRADPARAQRREVSPGGCRAAAAPQSVDLRRRRHHRAVRRHQGDRPAARGAAPGIKETHRAKRTQACVFDAGRLYGADRPGLSVPGDRHCAGHLPASGKRQPDRARRQGRRLGADRPAVFQAEVFLVAAFGHLALSL